MSCAQCTGAAGTVDYRWGVKEQAKGITAGEAGESTDVTDKRRRRRVRDGATGMSETQSEVRGLVVQQTG